MSASISVCWKAWPMCSVAVMFGGGSWMQSGVAFPGRCANQPLDSQRSYQRLSTARGSKLLSSMLGLARLGLARGGDGVRDRLAYRLAQLLLQLAAHRGN